MNSDTLCDRAQLVDCGEFWWSVGYLSEIQVEHNSIIFGFKMKQPDFYKSCDIIEFLTGDDAEGCQLASLFSTHGVRFILKKASTYACIDELFEDFGNAVAERNLKAKQNAEPLYSPELHFSCHGCKDGIGWPDGTLVTWSKLSQLLWSYSMKLGYVTSPKVNGAFAQSTSCLSLSLSCCLGGFAAPQFFSAEPFPIGGFMAPTDTIYINDCTQFFLRFYILTIDSPWNAPDKVSMIQREFMPKGPSGPSPIKCYVAPLTQNPNYTTPQKI